MRLALAALLTLLVGVSQAADESATGPPPFFLQDPSDSLCLAGEDFKRCSIDTLFYVVGAPGKYQIHKRPLEPSKEDDEDGFCLSKKDCKDPTKTQDTKVTKCSHCGAKNWNILGDAEQGYILTEGEGTLCLVRQGNKATLAPCDSQETPYTPLQLQFASDADITAMASPAARLIGAASDGDKKMVQTLLKEGTDVNVRDWDDLTALIPAASSGNIDICKLLVKEGIDVNAKDKDGITALMEASIMGHAKIVELLLDEGAELDAAANSEVTALWLAAGEGKTDVMKILLKKGADASNTRVDGITAIMTASIGGHEEAVKLLLENGADPEAADGDNLTPLMNAAENGTLAVVKLLMEASKDPAEYANRLSNSGYTALIVSTAHGNIDVMEYLLDHGADPNKMSENQISPLMYAASSNAVDAMKLLLDKAKVDIDGKHYSGGTALLEAASAQSKDAFKFLMDRGCKYDLFDDDHVSVLMAVASQGNFEAQNMILEAFKKDNREQDMIDHINAKSDSGGTSVMFAAAGGHMDCTKQLLDHGANIFEVARADPDWLERRAKGMEAGTWNEDELHVDGMTAMHVTAKDGHLEMINYLLELGVEVNVYDDAKRTPLSRAVHGNHGDVAIALVKAGADPNTSYTDDEGVAHNLLMDAITVENEAFARALVEAGADLYYQDDKKITTLLQASHRGLTEIVKILLEKHAGSDKEGYLDDPSDEGITPLLAAASEGHEEIVKLLVDAKADVNAKDKDGTTPLMAASARGHVDAVKTLLDAGANINDQNSDGHTALMFAYNGKNQVETLLERYSQFVTENEQQEEGSDDAGTGPIIEEALTKHNALVELLLKSGADTKLKDKEGHTAKDFDFHPDADAEVLKKEASKEKTRDESKNEL